ncbi:MAG: Na+/H+ antiporter NhaC, partial [uncultured bacterium]
MNKNKSLFSLLPLAVFLLLYLGIGAFFTIKGSDYAFYKFPASSCILIAFAVALIQGFKQIKEQLKYFLDGIRDEYVIIMLLIFLLAGAFSEIMKGMGGVESTVNLGLTFIPARMILPGLFLISCFISMAMGTSMGTLAAVVPIAAGFAQSANLPMALTMGTVLGGAMFGDNLSMVSDTTIAATSTQKCSMRSKFKMNIKIVLPAFFIVLIVLGFMAHPQIELKKYAFSFYKILPYFAVFILALLGVNVIIILMSGIFLAGIIGFSAKIITFLQFGEIIQRGFMSMTEVMFLTFFISGLAAIAERG